MNLKGISAKFLAKSIVSNLIIIVILSQILGMSLKDHFTIFTIFTILVLGTFLDIHFASCKRIKSFLKDGVCTITNKREDCDGNCMLCTISMKK